MHLLAVTEREKAREGERGREGEGFSNYFKFFVTNIQAITLSLHALGNAVYSSAECMLMITTSRIQNIV